MTSIPTLRGLTEETANLPSAAEGIASVLNPKYKLQKALIEASADPAKIQEYLNLEANSPGIIEKTYGQGRGTDTILAGRPDLKTQTQIDIGNKVSTDPNFRDAYIGKQALGQTPDEQRLAKAQADLGGTKATVAAATAGNEITQSNTEAQASILKLKELQQVDQDAQAALAKYPSLRSVNVGQLANRIYTGTTTGDDTLLLSRIRAYPDAQQAIKEAVDAYKTKAELGNRISIENLRLHDPVARGGLASQFKDLSNSYLMKANASVKAAKDLGFTDTQLGALLSGTNPKLNAREKKAADFLKEYQSYMKMSDNAGTTYEKILMSALPGGSPSTPQTAPGAGTTNAPGIVAPPPAPVASPGSGADLNNPQTAAQIQQAVDIIKGGTGTIQQLQSAGASPEVLAEVQRRLDELNKQSVGARGGVMRK